ncbi:MAG: hypothetical protein OEX07_02910, partial [Gammaproteobacteria bacterium]|nr:hypothetical protein [Gammaproteobacteria bacterium]
MTSNRYLIVTFFVTLLTALLLMSVGCNSKSASSPSSPAHPVDLNGADTVNRSGDPLSDTSGDDAVVDPDTNTVPDIIPVPTGRVVPVNDILIYAEAGSIQEVASGDNVILDGSRSRTYGSGTLTYRWSIANRPDKSTVQIENGTSEQSNFTPDVAGVYVVQLVVNSDGVNSKRDLVSIAVDKNLGSHHSGLSSNCVQCHTDGILSGKSPDHMPTSNVCVACHSTEHFVNIAYVDHSEVFGVCSNCHNGKLAIGKSILHVRTGGECNACHNTKAFLELSVNGTYDHTGIKYDCASCHNGVVATGKYVGHVSTEADCGYCHVT